MINTATMLRPQSKILVAIMLAYLKVGIIKGMTSSGATLTHDTKIRQYL
jgi:hypothetical protein